MTRKKLIAANWKMNKTPKEMGEFIRAFSEVKGQKVLEASRVEVLIAMPSVLIPLARDYGLPPEVRLGAQNMHSASHGAFTGELSAEMLLSVGVQSVVLGHSERRQSFGETDHAVALKVQVAVDRGLEPILCVGETRQEREAGLTEKVVARQVRVVLEGLRDPSQRLVIAYEPVWAIGTGLAASSDEANEVHRFIRGVAGACQGSVYADSLRIMYGGSVTTQNALDLFQKEDIDGALIGGASLDPRSFREIIEVAQKVVSIP